MKMCSKLVHYAFSSSPSKDVTMSTFCGFFFTFCRSVNLLMSFSLPKCDCKSVCVCMCVHPLNKDVSQAIIGTFFSVFYKT